MAQVIKHSEVLRIMESGEPFCITVVALDKKRKTGGQLVTYTRARKYRAGAVPAIRPEGEPKPMEVPAPQSTNPNHTRNGTINIKLPSGEIKKIHTRLIVKFNNREVIL